MKKDYRISRNVRLAWFLSHLHQTVQATPQELLVRPRDRHEELTQKDLFCWSVLETDRRGD